MQKIFQFNFPRSKDPSNLQQQQQPVVSSHLAELSVTEHMLSCPAAAAADMCINIWPAPEQTRAAGHLETRSMWPAGGSNNAATGDQCGNLVTSLTRLTGVSVQGALATGDFP